MSSSELKILVWDGPTRLCHWLAAALVVAAYLTWRLNWMDWHARAGYALLTLVIFRILWGSSAARRRGSQAFSLLRAPPPDTLLTPFAANPTARPGTIPPPDGWCCFSCCCNSAKR